MFKWRVMILALSLVGFGSSTLEAGVSQTTTFTLSVTVPEHSQLPAASLTGSQASDLTFFRETQHLHLQKDVRDDQIVYLASFVVD